MPAPGQASTGHDPLARADPEAEHAREAGDRAQRRRCTSPLLLRFFDPRPGGVRKLVLPANWMFCGVRPNLRTPHGLTLSSVHVSGTVPQNPEAFQNYGSPGKQGVRRCEQSFETLHGRSYVLKVNSAVDFNPTSGEDVFAGVATALLAGAALRAASFRRRSTVGAALQPVDRRPQRQEVIPA
jgi:hypothetical protein